jgi:hypothetical protein
MQRPVRHRRIIGGAVKEFLNKANQFLKKTQLLSNVGSVLNNTVVPMPFRPIGDKVIDYARSRGFGARKIKHVRSQLMRINRPKGGSLRVAGGAMSLAGGSRRNMLPRRLPSYF